MQRVAPDSAESGKDPQPSSAQIVQRSTVPESG